MKKLYLFIFFTFLSSNVFAATWTNGGQEVANIIWKPGYMGFYVKSSTFSNPEGCPGGASNLYLISSSVSEADVDRLYSMMLLAFSTGKTLTVWVDGCRGATPTFTGLQLDLN